MWKVFLGSALLVSALSSSIAAQTVTLLDCTEVRLLSPACEDPESEVPTPAPRIERAPAPLFPAQTIARETPPLMIEMLQDPSKQTLEYARALVAWQEQRRDVRLTIEQLLVQAQQERNQRGR